MGTPFKMKGHSLPGPNQASPMKNGKKTKKVPKRPGLDTSRQKKTNLEQQYSKKIYTTATGDLFTDSKGHANITEKDAARLYRESGGNKKYDYRGKTDSDFKTK